MNRVTIFLISCLCLGLLMGCVAHQTNDQKVEEMRFGKMITVTIREDEIVNADYLQKVKNKEIIQDVPYFDMLDEIEFSNLIKYMKENNYVIVPNQYTLNQAWKFDNGMFILNNGEKKEILKFKKK